MGLAYTDGRLVALSTGRAHVTPQRRLLMATVNHEIMAFGLAHDRLVDCPVQELVVFRGAQRTSQVSGIILTKAHVKSSSAREPNAIARLTEIVCERRNETQPPTSFLHAHVAGRATSTIIDIFKRIALGQSRSYDR